MNIFSVFEVADFVRSGSRLARAVVIVHIILGWVSPLRFGHDYRVESGVCIVDKYADHS